MSHETHGKFSFQFSPDEFGKFLRIFGLRSPMQARAAHRDTVDRLKKFDVALQQARWSASDALREMREAQLESALTWEHYFGVLKAEGIRHELTPLDELELLEMGIGGAP